MDRYIYTHSVASYHRRKQIIKVSWQAARSGALSAMIDELQATTDSAMMKALNAILEEVNNG